jgi:elongation factor Ts
MAAITASMVAELRAKTDAPMMECKKALTEAEGNMEKAEELLRVKLGNKAGKAACPHHGRRCCVRVTSTARPAPCSRVNCETDFVTKNDSFLALAKARPPSSIATQNPADVAALGALALQPGRLRPHAGRRAQGL